MEDKKTIVMKIKDVCIMSIFLCFSCNFKGRGWEYYDPIPDIESAVFSQGIWFVQNGDTVFINNVDSIIFRGEFRGNTVLVYRSDPLLSLNHYSNDHILILNKDQTIRVPCLCIYDVVYEKNRLLIEDSVTSMGSKTVGKHSFYFRKHRIEYNYQYSSEDADNLP